MKIETKISECQIKYDGDFGQITIGNEQFNDCHFAEIVKFWEASKQFVAESKERKPAK